MHSDEVILHEESGGTTWKTSYRCCIMRKVISKEVAIGRRFRFFLHSGLLAILHCHLRIDSNRDIKTRGRRTAPYL